MDHSELTVSSKVTDHRPHKPTTIVVNGRERSVTTDFLSFEEIVVLAFDPVPVGPNVTFTVTYRKGPKERPQGTLTPGNSVKVKKGMVFNVTATDQS